MLWISDASSAQPFPTNDLQSIVASGTLRDGMSRFDIPPFHRRRANGQIEGNDAELACQIDRALAAKVDPMMSMPRAMLSVAIVSAITAFAVGRQKHEDAILAPPTSLVPAVS